MPVARDNLGTKNNLLGIKSSINDLICSFDKRQILIEGYQQWDELTKLEYRQSGLCKECQDEVFVDYEADEEEDENDWYPPEYKITKYDFRIEDLDD